MAVKPLAAGPAVGRLAPEQHNTLTNTGSSLRAILSLSCHIISE